MSFFHKGEIAVQKAAGVEKMAQRIGGTLKKTIHPVAENFLRESPFVIAASTAANGNVWASVLYGDPGFIRVQDERKVEIYAAEADSLLRRNIDETGRIGLLAIEFDTRLRMRLNGKARANGDVIEIEAEEVFSNCQKYIQAREAVSVHNAVEKAAPVQGDSLTDIQIRKISEADTFFVASSHPTRGADASHRGGNPGFIRVIDDRTLLWPDYTGNMMFQTLGNIHENSSAGLLFIDFRTGASIQMTGRAEIVWDEREFIGLPGAERALKFTIEKTVEKKAALPLEWEFLDYSQSNPR